MDFFRKRFRRNAGMVLVLLALLLVVTACTSNNTGEDGKETIVFAEPDWESVAFHNKVAGLIIENGYGHPTDIEIGSTPITFTALREGRVNAYMEVWTDNLGDAYEEAIANGEVIEVSVNFGDSAQGLYVPTYVIEGDPERGIEPIAPDLKTIQDLPEYWEVFEDREDPNKGRIYGAIPGWEADEILQTKITNQGLDETYNYFSPGSDAALSTSIVSAYEAGEPWVGYYWEPTWLVGKYDMTLLGDIPYDEEKWLDGYGTEIPPVDVTVAVHKDLPKTAPDVVAFLENYETSSIITSEALAYMDENDASIEETAIWFLKEYDELWTSWVPEDIAQTIKDKIL